MNYDNANAASFEVMPATREKTSALIGLAGQSGSGKTLSAILMGAGMLNQGERLVVLDTENKRSSFYVDHPLVKAALPNGYDRVYMEAPFTPARYIQAMDAVENAGNVGVLVVDSASHEWEGFGGCCDIAENNRLGNNPNWAKAKLEHKKFMNKALARPYSTIFCLRAREKVEHVRDGGKLKIIQKGLQPIQEKGFKHEMLAACLMDSVTKMPQPIVGGADDLHKIPDLPEFIGNLFRSDRFITPDDGRLVRSWLNGGLGTVNVELEKLKRDCRDVAYNGSEALKAWWQSSPKETRVALKDYLAECKAIAAEVDASNASGSAGSNEEGEPQAVNF